MALVGIKLPDDIKQLVSFFLYGNTNTIMIDYFTWVKEQVFYDWVEFDSYYMADIVYTQAYNMFMYEPPEYFDMTDESWDALRLPRWFLPPLVIGE